MLGGARDLEGFRRETSGVSTNGSLYLSYLLTGTFWVLPLTYFYIPKGARAYLFPQSVKTHTSAAAPLVLTGFVRNQGFRRVHVADALVAREAVLQSCAYNLFEVLQFDILAKFRRIPVKLRKHIMTF